MKLTWLDVHKKYVVKDEQKPKKSASAGGIRESIKKDEDYKYMLACPRGEIYRHANDGSRWAVYLKATASGNKRFGLWHKLDSMNFTRTQTGDSEASWIFDADRLDDVAELFGMRKKKGE